MNHLPSRPPGFRYTPLFPLGNGDPTPWRRLDIAGCPPCAATGGRC